MKNEKQYTKLQLSMPGTKREFIDKVTADIHGFNGFTDKPVVHQCDFQVVENEILL